MSPSVLNESPPKEPYTPLGPGPRVGPLGARILDWDQGLSWGEGLDDT